jgi:hypothetical protein
LLIAASSERRVRLVAALAAFVVPFAIYAASLPPNVSYWDTGEMQTVPYIFGISHPTGFPVFVFAGWLFSHAIPFGSVAWRIDLMSSAAMAAAAYFVYRMVVELENKPILGVGAALLFATGEIAWTRGARAEVHAVAVALAACAVWAAVRFHRGGSPRALYASALACGLALANHGIATLLVPGFVLLLLPRARALAPATLWKAAAAFAAPGLLYLYLPLRSAYLYAYRVDPTLSLGLPPGRPFWDFGHPASLASFLHYLGGGDGSQVGVGFAGMLAFGQYGSLIARFGIVAAQEYGLIAIVFAVLGLALLARGEPWLALGLVLACGLCIPYGLLYPEADPDRYLLLAYWLIAVLAAVGVSRIMVSYLDRRDWVVDMLSLAIVFGLAFAQMHMNRAIFNQRNDTGPRDYIDKVILNTPDNAILIANWAYATPLGYAAFVERRLGHRIVVTAFPSEYHSYFGTWLKTRPIFLVNQGQYTDDTMLLKQISADPSIVKLELK